jgi:hypothetical protein
LLVEKERACRLWNVHGLRQVRQAAPSRLCFMHPASIHTTITRGLQWRRRQRHL